MLGKLSIIGAVAAISHDPHCTVRGKQHSPHGENLTNNLFASDCVSLRPIISFATFHLRGTSPHCQPPAWPCPRSKVGYAQPHGKSVGSQLAVHVTQCGK